MFPIILKCLIEFLKIIYCVSLKRKQKNEKKVLVQTFYNGSVHWCPIQKVVWIIVDGSLILFYFYVDFDIRQVFPFSPLAIVVAIDLLAIKIRHLQNIKGIRNWSLNNVSYIQDTIKTDFYADDTALFLNDEDDRRYALNVIHEFSIFYGLEVNKTKSHAIAWTPLFFFSFFFFWLLFNIIGKSCHLRF